MSRAVSRIALFALVLSATATPFLVGATAATNPAGSTATTNPAGPTATTNPAGSTAAHDPEITAVLPNPVADGDTGEYVRLSLPPGTWTLTDGESAVTVSRVRAGVVVLTRDPDALLQPPAGSIVSRGLRLSNAGERLVLRRGGPNGTVVDAIEYRRAPEGETWVRNADPNWRPVGVTVRDPVALGATNATVFLLPDAPKAPVEPIRAAERRVLVAGYTFQSERVARALIAARRRGADVRVLLEGAPVGGIAVVQARLLDRLVAAGVDVRVVAGPHARVRYHHAKYAVADDEAVVLTENWKPSGTGGADSRGWGVVLRSDRSANALATLFREDSGWLDGVPWRRFRNGRTFRRDAPATGSYPTRHPPARVRIDRVGLLTAPDNAEASVVGVVDDADVHVDVLQPTVSDGPMLTAIQRAAARGVEVRLLLSNAWYVAEENAALAARLNRWADRRGVPFEARVASPGGRYGKIHAKGVVADDVAIVGSLNWNPTSARENREVVVALEGRAVAEYYRDGFAADWRESRHRWDLPPALSVAAVGGVAIAVLYARRRIEFETEVEETLPPRDG